MPENGWIKKIVFYKKIIKEITMGTKTMANFCVDISNVHGAENNFTN